MTNREEKIPAALGFGSTGIRSRIPIASGVTFVYRPGTLVA